MYIETHWDISSSLSMLTSYIGGTIRLPVEMVVHTLFEIYFKLGLHFKDMSARGVELFV